MLGTDSFNTIRGSDYDYSKINVNIPLSVFERLLVFLPEQLSGLEDFQWSARVSSLNNSNKSVPEHRSVDTNCEQADRSPDPRKSTLSIVQGETDFFTFSIFFLLFVKPIDTVSLIFSLILSHTVLP